MTTPTNRRPNTNLDVDERLRVLITARLLLVEQLITEVPGDKEQPRQLGAERDVTSLVLARRRVAQVERQRAEMQAYQANHPHTVHLCQDIWQVDPREATGGRPVGLMWASPDCRHFSKAKGGRPVSRQVRDLANVVVEWAAAVGPRVVMLENVEEFRTWGPLDDRGTYPRKDSNPGSNHNPKPWLYLTSELTGAVG